MIRLFLTFLLIICLLVTGYTGYLLIAKQINPIIGVILSVLNIGVLIWNLQTRRQLTREWFIKPVTVMSMLLAVVVLASSAFSFSDAGPLSPSRSTADINSLRPQNELMEKPPEIPPQPQLVAKKPEVLNFSANPTEIIFGATATLSWMVSEATTITLDQGIGEVQAIGSIVISPTVTTAYTLTATNAVGSVTTSVMISVKPPVPPVSPQVPYQGETNNKEARISLLEYEILALVNTERSTRKISPLSWDSELGGIARKHSQEMANRGELFHSPVNEPYAENVWMGAPGNLVFRNPDVTKLIVGSWMGSLHHKTWLLCPNLKHIGVGIFVSEKAMYVSWTFWRGETDFRTDWWYCNGSNAPPGWLR